MAFEKTNYQVSSSLLVGISLLILLGYYVFSINLLIYNQDGMKDTYTWLNPLTKGLITLKIVAGIFLVLSVFSAQVRKDHQGKLMWFIMAALGGFFVYF